jgi:hypothetical protein
MTPAPSRDVLIAAGECVRVIGILIDSPTPHSRALAAVVGVRLKALLTGDDAAPEPMSPDAVGHWLALAEVLDAYARPAGGKVS